MFFISGLPNSGTSMIAHISQASGYNLGNDLKPPDSHNPNGYFEDVPSMLLLDNFIKNAGHDFGAMTPHDLTSYKSGNELLVAEYIQGLRSRNIDCVKDCRLLIFSHLLMSRIKNARLLLILRRLDKCIASNNRYHSSFSRKSCLQTNLSKGYQKNLISFCLEMNEPFINEGRVCIVRYEDIMTAKRNGSGIGSIFRNLSLLSSAFEQIVDSR